MKTTETQWHDFLISFLLKLVKSALCFLKTHTSPPPSFLSWEWLSKFQHPDTYRGHFCCELIMTRHCQYLSHVSQCHTQPRVSAELQTMPSDTSEKKKHSFFCCNQWIHLTCKIFYSFYWFTYCVVHITRTETEKKEVWIWNFPKLIST